MTYIPHYLLAFGGHSGHSQEQWACNIRLIEESFGVGGDVDEEEYLDDVVLPALTAWFMAPNARVHEGVRLQWFKFNKIGPNGRYLETGVTHERTTAIPGGMAGTSNAHPLQVCMVLTWRTNAVSRGLGSVGRIFMPRPVVPIDVNGDFDSTIRAAAATQAATFLNTLDVTLGTGDWMRPAIVSRGHGPGYVDEGPAYQIDTVEVDSCLDIQRRRAFSQSREKSSAPVTY